MGGTPLAFSVERRLTRGLWLTLRGDWRRSHDKSNPHDRIFPLGVNDYATEKTSETISSSTWGASIGARYVVNAGSSVEFGPFVALGLAGSSANTTTTIDRTSTRLFDEAQRQERESSASSLGPTAGVGFTVEAFLARSVSLRLSSLLVSVTSSAVESDSKFTITPGSSSSNIPAQPTKNTSHSTNWGFTLSPVIELRITL